MEKGQSPVLLFTNERWNLHVGSVQLRGGGRAVIGRVFATGVSDPNAQGTIISNLDSRELTLRWIENFLFQVEQ